MTIATELTNESDANTRLCIVSRDAVSREAGLRFVVDPDGACVFDARAKLPGRGVWLTANKDALEKAMKTGAFARGFKQQVSVAEDLTTHIEAALLKRCQNHLSLCQKAGELVLGAGAIENFIEQTSRHALRCLIQAKNSDRDSRRSLSKRAFRAQESLHWAGAMLGEELGEGLGKSFVAHCAIKSGSMAQGWQLAYNKLIGFRDAPEIAWNASLNPLNSIVAAAH